MKDNRKSIPLKLHSCRSLPAVVLTASLAGMALAAPGADNDSHVWRAPDDAAWELISGRGEVEKAADGWIWRARPVDRGGQIGIRPPVAMADYDEIRFEYKPLEGPVQVMVTTDGFPNSGQSRNWYDKNIQVQNGWNDISLDLRLDDDGCPVQRPDGQDLWIRFGNRPAVKNDDPSRRAVAFRNVRLIHYPVAWSIDYFNVREELKNGHYEVRYPVVFRNKTPVEQKVEIVLTPEAGANTVFAYPETTRFTLARREPDVLAKYTERWGTGLTETKGDVTVVWLTFRLPEERLAALPSLYSEVVWPTLRIEGFDETLHLLHSSRREPLVLAAPPRPLPAPVPVLEATPDGLERAVVRNRENPPFQGVLDALLAAADRALATPLIMPGQNSGLKVGKPGETGTPYQDWNKRNSENFDRALLLARAYALTGKESYRGAALTILEAYADHYLEWDPLRPSTTAFTTRMTANTLGTGFQMPPIFLAYDYLRASLPEEQRRYIETRFLEPVARALDGHVNEYTNQMTVQNLPVFFYAVMRGQWSLAMRYVVGPRGLAPMREYGFDADGMGMEHDLGYHWNTLDPMIRTMITLGNLGYDEGDVDLESLVSLPILLSADPSEFHGGFPFRYEWAFAKYGKPIYAAAGLVNKGRRTLDGLLIGADTLPPREDIDYPPTHLKETGYVTLRHRAPGGLRGISVNYGAPHHRSHIDYLSVHVSEAGKELIGMMGQMGKPGRKGWFSTIADSLLLVDGRDQITGRGRLVRMEPGKEWAALEVATSPAAPLYEPDVTYHRLVFSGPDFVALLDRAEAPEPVAFQWALYPGSDMETPADWTATEHPGLADGYEGGPVFEGARWNWRRAPLETAALTVNAEVMTETECTPAIILTNPAQWPYAFTTPGNRKPGDINALLMVGKNQTGANWTAVLDRSQARTLKVSPLDVTDATGAPLAPGRAVAVCVEAPSGAWVIGMADPALKASVPGVGAFENGWLVVGSSEH